jgi:hypothetical protein
MLLQLEALRVKEVRHDCDEVLFIRCGILAPGVNSRCKNLLTSKNNWATVQMLKIFDMR